MSRVPVRFRPRARRARPAPQSVYLKLVFMGALLVVVLAIILNPGLLYRVGLPREEAPVTRPAGPDVPARSVRIVTESLPATRPTTSRAAPSPWSETRPAGLPLGIDRAILNDVEDLQPIETGAYFEALKAVRALPEAAFAQPGLPQVTLADLLEEPALFRGRLVTVRGNLRRLERQPLGENAAGLSRVHEGQIRHDGSGFFTFVVIDDPPPEARVGRDVECTAVFLKVWVYRDQRETLRRTPLLMGRRLVVLEPQYPDQFQIPLALGTAVGVLLVALMVLAVVFYRRGDRRFYRRFRVPGRIAPPGFDLEEPTPEAEERATPDGTHGEEPDRGCDQP